MSTVVTGRLLPADAPELAPSSQLDDVVALLEEHDPATAGPGPDQVRYRAEMLAFAAEHPDALVRSCVEGHFTGSAFVVDAAGERALLLLHTKLRRWLQPGGHADGDANLAAVALREATEETGIAGLVVDPEPLDLDIHEIPERSDPAHLHLDVRFLVLAPPDAVVIGNHESQGLRWVAPGDLDALDLDPGLHRLAAAAFARARSHLGGTAPAGPRRPRGR